MYLLGQVDSNKSVTVPSFEVNPTLLLGAVLLLSVALWLRKGEPTRRRKRSRHERRQKQIASLEESLKKLRAERD